LDFVTAYFADGIWLVTRLEKVVREILEVIPFAYLEVFQSLQDDIGIRELGDTIKCVGAEEFFIGFIVFEKFTEGLGHLGMAASDLLESGAALSQVGDCDKLTKKIGFFHLGLALEAFVLYPGIRKIGESFRLGGRITTKNEGTGSATVVWIQVGLDPCSTKHPELADFLDRRFADGCDFGELVA
jgi:hypothetical protein